MEARIRCSYRNIQVGCKRDCCDQGELSQEEREQLFLSN